MKCPYCDYVNGWDSETLTSVEGEHGKFYEGWGNIMRRLNFDDAQFTQMNGCPKCKKVFID